MPRRTDLNELKATMEGKRFQYLTILNFSGLREGRRYWMCRCDCGVEREIQEVALLHGRAKSCGCKRYQFVAAALRTHGLKRSPTYKTWCAMKSRCLNPNDPRHKDYGGRGIAVCQRWIDSFEAFLQDMGPRPSREYQIERRDNQAGYNPENCYWATRTQQAQNKRTSRLVTIAGVTKCVAEWARVLDISESKIRYRLKRGIPLV